LKYEGRCYLTAAFFIGTTAIVKQTPSDDFANNRYFSDMDLSDDFEIYANNCNQEIQPLQEAFLSCMILTVIKIGIMIMAMVFLNSEMVAAPTFTLHM